MNVAAGGWVWQTLKHTYKRVFQAEQDGKEKIKQEHTCELFQVHTSRGSFYTCELLYLTV